MKFIYVVKRRDLDGLIPQIGLVFPSLDTCADRFGRGFFLERPHAERDPEFKQVIPYTVLWRDDEVFVFERLTGGGEARLHNLLSIGVGGHIEPMETSGVGVAGRSWDMIRAAALREIEEEVHVDSPESLVLEYRGLINDESNEVGTVHTGVLFFARLPAGTTVTVRETEVLAGHFEPVQKLRAQNGEAFETWSRHILDALPEAR
ncbi:NUDIX domain-containing protein [Myxococcota bacterium]|nr:NUDIX domain-containing protein [Myxococcota bacterium]MBU1509235.1 NUDIX domain-containing protein [Myxococcota bacterium]